MNLYSKIAELELEVEKASTETREKQVSEDFTRKTTVVKLEGKGETGKGEDVIYESEKHVYPELELEGSYTFQEFSKELDKVELFPEDIEHSETDASYRRWAVESAALDLALKQNNLTLAEALDREYSPLRFVVSPSMDGPRLDKLEQLIEVNPGIEFKLDASEEWDREFVEKLREMDRVRVVDLKGQYKKENVAMKPNPGVYRLVAEELNALIEDPKLNDETMEVLEGHHGRITWDKPITGIESIEELPFKPEVLNIKPSRFGTVESLLDTVEYCIENGIEMYGGGQFELDVGREHIHAFASLFYPDSSNDVAPREYNQEKVPEGVSRSPLEPGEGLKGLRWRFS